MLPAFNAGLNATSAVLLVLGYLFVRRHHINAHRAAMGAAFITSTIFLISYLIYHAQVGSVRFQGQGPIRILYFAILISHTILAVVIVPMILRTLYLAVKKRFAEHRRIARWALPLWLYVSVTGVTVYLMLYRLNASSARFNGP